MGETWKRRYSFRLTEDDIEINDFMEQIPARKRSETIRKMLTIAYRHMQAEMAEQRDLQKVMAELTEMKEMQQQVMEMLERGVSPTSNKFPQEQEGAVSKDAVFDTAQSFLSSFGIDMNA
ncbi:hypothetical protein [Oceanobacillus damuensis]|uniref:hypothetical protein n=1 Tax=Oceanobacillus damuensis TaxID=937928 RepID=UPI0008329159|nr:hypothetical protein [Oceanobacillus damuensis]